KWPDFLNESQAQATLEPYLQGFSFDSNAVRLIRPLASRERIYGLGERTGTMNKRGHAFPIWNVDPPHPHNWMRRGWRFAEKLVERQRNEKNRDLDEKPRKHCL
ncbi:MAG: hypothetical protein ACXV4B_01135, partial [Halobacteriota archaeon]